MSPGALSTVFLADNADNLAPGQLKQLAAVMLGLVVFAAVFVLVERQRGRRGKEDAAPPPFEEERPTPSPKYAAAAPTTVPTTLTTSRTESNDGLPVPFVPRSHQPEPPPAPPPPVVAAPAAGEVPEPEPMVPFELPPLPTTPPERPAELPPESPDQIGIVIPDEPAAPAGPGQR